MSFKFGASSGSSAPGGTSSSIAGGGGLYAGISLGGAAAAKKPTNEPAQASTTDSPNLDPTSNANAVNSLNDQEQFSTNNLPKADGKKDDDKSKASSWSSSLRFAPVIRKQAAKSTAKPFAVPFSSTTSVTTKSGLAATAFAPDDEHETATSNPTARVMHIPGRAKAALNAPAPVSQASKPPSVFARKGGFLAAHAPERIPGAPNTSGSSGPGTPNIQSVVEKVDSNIPGFKHSLPAMLAQTTTLKGLVPSSATSTTHKIMKKKLDQPPPLTLPDDEFGTGGGGDVNGFAQSEAGRKLALRAARNSKKSKKKGKSREVDPAILFMEDYDPARPNDYNDWMNFVKRRREQQREALRLERQRQQREELSESSYYSSDDDGNGSDDARAAPRGNFFAPPPEYHETTTKNEATEPRAQNAPVSTRPETGDEAYARRVALSHGIPYQSPHAAEDAEVALADGSTEAAATTDVPPALPTPVVSVADAQARAKAIAERLQKLKGCGNEPSGAPSAPGGYPSEPPVAVATTSNPSATLLEAQAKAKLVAAKLAALNGPKPSGFGLANASNVAQQSNEEASSSLVPPETKNKAPGQPDFARRLMDKYGWKEGQGLGASESGRTSILTVAPTGPAGNGNKKRKENPGEMGAAGPMGPNKVGAMAKGRGIVIDEAKNQRDLAENIRYGEPTRIVYLTNVVAVDEVDDGLATEIAEEAGKHGIVERCFVRTVQRADVDDGGERVRVFILYSGLVGAWKAVKSFDGRFFGGRTIRARFFAENAFTLGDWDA